MILKTEDFVNAKLYKNEEAVVQDSLRYLLQARPALRIELAIYQYQTYEISLGKAANLAGVSFEQMKEVLLNRGVPLKLGPVDEQDAKQEIAALRGYLNDRSDQ